MNPEELQQLQFLEQNVRSLAMQKQAFQMDLTENTSALNEVKKSKDSVYKIIGQLMIKIDKKETLKELEGKEKLINSRLKTLEKQEKEMNESMTEIRSRVMKAEDFKVAK